MIIRHQKFSQASLVPAHWFTMSPLDPASSFKKARIAFGCTVEVFESECVVEVHKSIASPTLNAILFTDHDNCTADPTKIIHIFDQHGGLLASLIPSECDTIVAPLHLAPLQFHAYEARH